MIRDILETLELPADTILTEAESPENKLALRSQTEQAAERGLFGAPSFITPDGELFWGNDRLEDALAWAALPPPRANSAAGH